jgi:hypothetical protein
MDQFSNIVEDRLKRYKVHVFVFLLAFFIAITFAHPSILITDEWVTVNQLAQLHDGHQIIFNEGKYGTFENGTLTKYFSVKHNYLAYPLVLSLISLPAYWLIDLFGGNFVFFILYIWTFLLIAIALFLNAFFREYTYIGKWRWTTGLIIVIFVIFFINLLFYQPFPVTGKDTYPEIIAIVFTNIILFALLAVMVYEIIRTIFKDSSYAIFGTAVCLSCSSYLFWTNFCKDHALVAFLFTAVVIMVVKFLLTDKTWYLPGAFVVSGLLAWARPELALFIFAALCVLVAYIYVCMKNRISQNKNKLLLILSPLFTLIGAIPFFVNNYLFTKNIFLPAWVLWNTELPSPVKTVADSAPLQQPFSDTIGTLLATILRGTNIRPSTFFADLYGILLNPQSGSIGVLALAPLFLVAVLLILVFWAMKKNIHFSSEEKHIIAAMVILSLGVFFAYIRGISGMNVSPGIVPDIRYLSPMYLPLNLIGLMVIRKINSITDKTLDLLTWMVSSWILAIPLSVIVICGYYPPAKNWVDIFPLLDAWTSVVVYTLILIFFICIIISIVFKKPMTPAKIFLALICAVPFIWQIDATFLARMYGAGLGGYSFWLPILLKIFGLIF